jgi:hypothetical protein
MAKEIAIVPCKGYTYVIVTRFPDFFYIQRVVREIILRKGGRASSIFIAFIANPCLSCMNDEPTGL